MNPDESAPFHLDRPGVRASFDRASAGYEAAAVLQARVADELLSRLEPFKFTPGVVLDLGSGTGRMTGELKRRYRRALVVALDLAPGMLREASATNIYSAASSESARTRYDYRSPTQVWT